MQQRFNTFSVSRVLRLKLKPNPALKLVDYGERRAKFWVRSELLITRFRAKGKPETRPSNAQQSRRHTARRQTQNLFLVLQALPAAAGFLRARSPTVKSFRARSGSERVTEFKLAAAAIGGAQRGP